MRSLCYALSIWGKSLLPKNSVELDKTKRKEEEVLPFPYSRGENGGHPGMSAELGAEPQSAELDYYTLTASTSFRAKTMSVTHYHSATLLTSLQFIRRMRRISETIKIMRRTAIMLCIAQHRSSKPFTCVCEATCRPVTAIPLRTPGPLPRVTYIAQLTRQLHNKCKPATRAELSLCHKNAYPAIKRAKQLPC